MDIFGEMKQNISNQIHTEGVCFFTAAWKWLGEEERHVVKAQDPFLDEDLNVLLEMYDAVEQSDVVVMHNGNRHDILCFKTRLVLNNLPPKRVKIVDTLQNCQEEF